MAWPLQRPPPQHQHQQPRPKCQPSSTDDALLGPSAAAAAAAAGGAAASDGASAVGYSDLGATLKRCWGYDAFRPLQHDVAVSGPPANTVHTCTLAEHNQATGYPEGLAVWKGPSDGVVLAFIDCLQYGHGAVGSSGLNSALPCAQ